MATLEFLMANTVTADRSRILPSGSKTSFASLFFITFLFNQYRQPGLLNLTQKNMLAANLSIVFSEHVALCADV